MSVVASGCALVTRAKVLDAALGPSRVVHAQAAHHSYSRHRLALSRWALFDHLTCKIID